MYREPDLEMIEIEVEDIMTSSDEKWTGYYSITDDDPMEIDW